MNQAEVQVTLHTHLFRRCLEQMTEEQARIRLEGRTNSAAFVAAHLVDSRTWTCRMLGLELPEPFGGAIVYGTSIEDVTELPGLEEILDEWKAVSAVLEGRVQALTAEELARPASQRFPVEDPSVAGALGFLLHHEAYHIGQLALLRRAVGLPAMRYK